MNLAVLPPDFRSIALAPVEEINALAHAEVVPVLFLPPTASQFDNLLKRGHQGPAGALGREHVLIGLALEVADEIAEHEAKVEQHHRQQRQTDQHAENGSRRRGNECQQSVEEIARQHEVRQRLGQGAGQQAEAEEQGDIEHQVPPLDMPDLMGEHAVQFVRGQGFEQGRGDHQIAQAGQDAHDGGGQDLPLEQRPDQDRGMKTLGPAEPDDMVADRSRRQRRASPEQPDQGRKKQHQKDHKQTQKNHLAPGRTQQPLQPLKRQDGQQIKGQGERQPGQDNGQIGLEIGANESPGSVPTMEQPCIAWPSLSPDDGQKKKKAPKPGDVGQRRHSAPQGQGPQIILEIEQIDKSDKQRHRRDLGPLLGGEIAGRVSCAGKQPSGQDREQPGGREHQHQGRQGGHPWLLRWRLGGEDKDGYKKKEQIIVEHTNPCHASPGWPVFMPMNETSFGPIITISRARRQGVAPEALVFPARFDYFTPTCKKY